MENLGSFLDNKYPELAGSKPVERAVQKKKQSGEKAPHLRDERVDTYIDRLEEIINNKRGFELLKFKVLEKYTTKPEDVSEKYWENQEAEERKMGKGADWDSAKSNMEMLKKLKSDHLETVLNDQRSSLEQWVDYFASSESDYLPSELKYWVFRSVIGMQELVKKKDGEREFIEFPKRSRGTVKPFPDINHEALAYVIDAIKTKFSGKEIEFEHDIQPDEREEFKNFLEKEDFSKLYAWANELMSTVPEHLLPVTEGEWVKYEQGSDPAELVKTIRGKGTGWCTAGKNTAAKQLQGGDFYVYYTLDDDGKPTIPRIAIRMEGHDKIAEPPRGIAYKQNLDPYMPEVLKTKLAEFGVVGETYIKRAQNMELLTSIEQKTQKQETLTREDLMFLYEMNSPIKGFGYKTDPRIAEIRGNRNVKEDTPIIFECSSEKIATNISELNENSIAYIGKWNAEVMREIEKCENIKYLYEEFPNKSILYKTIETNPDIKNGADAKRILESNDVKFGGVSTEILRKVEFSNEIKKFDLVSFSVEQLGFPGSATTAEIYQRADELGLKLCPAEVGPLLRLAYKDQKEGEYLLVAMKPILSTGGNPRLFGLGRRSGGVWLDTNWVNPGNRWFPQHRFVFSRK